MTQTKPLFIFLFLLPILLFSHPGKTDKNGGHYDRKTGHYHYHKKPDTVNAAGKTEGTSAAIKKTDFNLPDSSSTSERINAYFRQANENVGVFDCDVKIYERNLPEKLKTVIKNRDGNKCVICGSTIQLEVDHSRALMNGGDNSVSNLATLCDVCHVIKTRMDNAIRRKREKLCGKRH